MNDYILIAIISVISVISLIALVHWRYGYGVMTRIFRVVIISIATTGYVGFVLGKGGINTLSLPVSVSIVVMFVITMVIIIQRTIIDRLQMQADTVSRVVKDLSTTSNEAALSAEEQSSSVAQVSAAIEEIHQMSQSTANTSQDVVRAAGQAVEQGREGVDSIQEVIHVMERLAQTSDFIEVVNQVAEQSNLLAFNAGIEAAKAEEYGRGFSVVASEVRNLAEQSKQAAKQIRESIRYTETGQKAIHLTDAVISELGNVLRDSSEKARQISGAAVQQSAGIKQISDAMSSLIQSGNNAALTSRQIKDAAQELYKVTDQLSLIIHGHTQKDTISSS